MTNHTIMSRKAHMRSFARKHGIKFGHNSFFTMWPHWGAASVYNLKLIQKYLHLPETGEWSPEIQLHLYPQEPMTVAQAAIWYYNYHLKHGGIHYEERRPMLLRRIPDICTPIDCSNFATLSFLNAYKPDPNGNGYNGWGNTSTLWEHGERITLAEHPGEGDDLSFYSDGSKGEGVPTHVAVCIGGNEVVSMGHEGDPSRRSILYRPDFIGIRRY